MSELSVHAGLRLLVEARAMTHFQLEPRSAVPVFGQDQTHLLHSKIFFDPSRPAQGRCFEQRQNISSFCRSCTRFVIFILHDITPESLLETVTVAYVTMSSTCNLRFTWTVDNWMLTVFIPLVSYSAPMTLPLLHALWALLMHHGTGMMICLCLGSRSC